MDSVIEIFKFINDLYISYIDLLIHILKIVHIENPLFAITIGNLVIYAFPYSALLRESYTQTLFSISNVFFTLFMSTILLFLTENWTDSRVGFIYIALTSFSIFELAGEEEIRSKTIEHALDRRDRRN